MSFERRRRTVLRPSVSALAQGRLGRAMLVTGATFLIGYTVAAQWLFPAAEDPTDVDFTEVPDLTSLELDEAAQELVELGFVPSVRSGLNHPEIAAGSVVAQSPLPGQVARAGDTVTLTPSAGFETRLVPDLNGLAGDEAATLLRDMGFNVDIVRSRASSRAGVLSSRPAAGTRVDVPSSIELVVSEGRAIVSVPDLRGRHVDDLDDILEGAQLRLGAVSYQVDAPEVPGRVVSQSPAPGSSLRGDGLVSVVVAGTPPDSADADLTDEIEAVRDTLGNTTTRGGGR